MKEKPELEPNRTEILRRMKAVLEMPLKNHPEYPPPTMIRPEPKQPKLIILTDAS